jgi:hypothetical protein
MRPLLRKSNAHAKPFPVGVLRRRGDLLERAHAASASTATAEPIRSASVKASILRRGVESDLGESVAADYEEIGSFLMRMRPRNRGVSIEGMAV